MTRMNEDGILRVYEGRIEGEDVKRETGGELTEWRSIGENELADE